MVGALLAAGVNLVGGEVVLPGARAMNLCPIFARQKTHFPSSNWPFWVVFGTTKTRHEPNHIQQTIDFFDIKWWAQQGLNL